jgi:hypothetical protein
MAIKQSNNSFCTAPLQASNSQQMEVSGLSASVSKTGISQLGADFKPSNFSVICGRGKDSYDHVGNHHFRELASMFVARYSRASSKADKSIIVSDMVGIIHQADGIFCKFEKGAWFKVEDHYAREKAGSLLRDMVSTTTQPQSPVKAMKAHKTKAKPSRPRSQKQSKTQNQQCSEQLVDGTTGHSDGSTPTQQCSQQLADMNARHSYHGSTPTQQCSEQQLVGITASHSYTQHCIEELADMNARHSYHGSTPTQQQCSEQLVECGTPAGITGQSDDSSSVSTLTYWGDDPSEDYRLEDDDDFFDIFGVECCVVGIPSSLFNGGPYYY